MGDMFASRTDKEVNLKFEAIQIIGGNRGFVSNVILDHCSISWGIDKNLGIWGRDREYGRAIRDITIQWCISSEALNSPLHPKGNHHAMGMVFSGVRNATAHHNLIAHCNARNPQISKYTEGESINNVIYDWGTYATEIQAGARVNVIGNYYKPGKSWERKMKGIRIEGTETSAGRAEIYVKGNIGPGRESATNDDWDAVLGDPSQRSSDPVIPNDRVTAQSAEEAYTSVLEFAGALPRDSVDRRIVADVRNGTGANIASQEDVGGLPVLRGGAAPTDTDKDGMPDEWESSHGLDPSDRSDASGDRNSDGYTNIEEYVNSLIPMK
jgi:hypothetical protein